MILFGVCVQFIDNSMLTQKHLSSMSTQKHSCLSKQHACRKWRDRKTLICRRNTTNSKLNTLLHPSPLVYKSLSPASEKEVPVYKPEARHKALLNSKFEEESLRIMDDKDSQIEKLTLDVPSSADYTPAN